MCGTAGGHTSGGSNMISYVVPRSPTSHLSLSLPSAISTPPFFLPPPLPPTHSSLLPSPPCLPVAASASSSLSPPRPSCTPLRPILIDMSFILNRQAKYLRLMSAFWPHFCPPLPTSSSDPNVHSFQSLCCAHVFLPLETVSVRSHGQEWARLLPGCGE